MIKFNIENTIILAGFTIVGSLSAYFFQLGFYNYFQVPYLFVTNSIESTILGTLLSTLFGTILFIPIYFGLKLPKTEIKYHETSFKEQIVGISLVFLFLEIGLIFTFKFTIYFIISSITLFIVLAFLLFGLPFFYFPKEKSYKEIIKKYIDKLNQEKKIESKKNVPLNIIEKLKLFFPYPQVYGYILYGFIMIIYIALSYAVGSAFGQSNTNFQIYTENRKKYILLGTYQQNLLLKQVDTYTKKTQKEIILIPNTVKTLLTSEQLGVLNYKPKKNKRH